MIAFTFHTQPSELDAMTYGELLTWAASARWVHEELGRAAKAGGR